MNPLSIITGAVVGVSIAWWFRLARSRQTGRQQALAITGVGLVGVLIGMASMLGWLPDWSGSLGLALTAMAGGGLVLQPRRAVRGD